MLGPSRGNGGEHRDAQGRELGTVTVIGRRTTSLPTQIPTTLESIDASALRVRINATDAEDALKYFPSLLVRKRYIGDYDHAVLGSRASGTNNSARSLVYADGILISNLLGNGATFTPRWGLVTPEEIERVDVLYGPFSAAYPGNSVGAVVDYVTRMPEELELAARVSSFSEDFSIYRSQGTYEGWQASASVGNAHGPWSWWLNFNRLDSDAHPVSYANKLVSAGVPDTAGTAVTGALASRNPREQEWLILGSTTATHTVQDHAKLKVGYAISPRLHLRYTLGWWDNDARRASETYLRDAAGNPVYSGAINVDGLRYTVTPADFAPTAGDLRHLMHGLSLKSERDGAWNFEVVASVYDYDRDLVRSPTVALPEAAVGRRRTHRGPARHGLELGRVAHHAQAERATTATFSISASSSTISGCERWSRTPWIGARARRPRAFSAFRGDSELASVYAQDTWAFAPQWRTTLGVRVERWSAANGAVSDATTTLGFAERSATHVSPKLAIARQLTPEWSLKASLGRAVRLPTVAELYQGSIAANVIVNNDPNLKPEKSWTSELSGERALGMGNLRLTAFFEDTARRALLADECHCHAGRHEHPKRRRDRHARPRGRVRVAGVARRPARFLGERDVRAVAHRAQREFSGERGEMAAARARVARQRPRNLSRRLAVVADGRRPLQRHAVQHARQLGSERLRVHGDERVRRVRRAGAVRERALQRRVRNR